jgi:hypothetical protein
MNKKTILTVITLLMISVTGVKAQVIIGSLDDPQSFSMLELDGNGTLGFRLPQMTTVERDAMEATAAFQAEKKGKALGLRIFNTTTKCIDTWNGNVWIQVCTVLDPPIANGTQVCCSGATVAGLVALGYDIKWYDSLSKDAVVLPATTELIDGDKYYASQTVDGIESERTAVKVTVDLPDAPTANASQSFCGSATVANLVATADAGGSIKWYDAQTGGTPLVTSGTLADNTTYYASQVSGHGCEGNARAAVTVTINPSPNAPTANTPQSFCISATVANLTATADQGGTIKWYDTETGGTPLALSVALADNTTYYASQVSATGCESRRTEVTVTIGSAPGAPTANASQSFCSGATVADLVATTDQGGSIKWYSVATNGSPLATSVTLVNNTTYYASQVSAAGCESTARTAVTVTIGSTPGAPTVISSQYLCSGSTVAILRATPDTGGSIRWYSTETGGTPLDPSVALVHETKYYASQVSAAGCESTARREVYVMVDTECINIPVPAGVPPVQFMAYNLGANPAYDTPKKQMQYLAEKLYTPNSMEMSLDATVHGGLYQWGRWAKEYSGPASSGNYKRYTDMENVEKFGSEGIDDVSAYNNKFLVFAGEVKDWRLTPNDGLWGNGKMIDHNFETPDRNAVPYNGGYYQKPAKPNAFYPSSGDGTGDPCPDWFRVPTQDEWERLINYDHNPTVGALPFATDLTQRYFTTEDNRLTWVRFLDGKAYAGGFIENRCTSDAGCDQQGNPCTCLAGYQDGSRSGWVLYNASVWANAAEKYKDGTALLYEQDAPEPLLFFSFAGSRHTMYNAASYTYRPTVKAGLTGQYWSSSPIRYSNGYISSYLVGFSAQRIATTQSDGVTADFGRKDGKSIRCVRQLPGE